MVFDVTFSGANLAVDWTLARAIFRGTETPFITPARTLTHAQKDKQEMRCNAIEELKDRELKDRELKEVKDKATTDRTASQDNRW